MFNSKEITPDEHQSWFARIANDPDCRVMIGERQDGPVGFVQFSGVNSMGVVDWGFYVRPDAPKRTGSEMCFAALDYAFSELGLHKVCGRVLAFNEPSIRLHIRLGFHLEGILRDQQKIENDYVSVQCFGLLRSEWPIARGALVKSTSTSK